MIFIGKIISKAMRIEKSLPTTPPFPFGLFISGDFK